MKHFLAVTHVTPMCKFAHMPLRQLAMYQGQADFRQGVKTMTDEQYGREHLEWNAEHNVGPDIIVSIASIAAAFLTFCLVF